MEIYYYEGLKNIFKLEDSLELKEILQIQKFYNRYFKKNIKCQI